jgi:hypothetical protein
MQVPGHDGILVSTGDLAATKKLLYFKKGGSKYCLTRKGTQTQK